MAPGEIRRPPRRSTAAAIVCLAALITPLQACGDKSSAPSPEAAAGAAARAYLSDLLRWQAGRLAAGDVRSATPALRHTLQGSRRPPASLDAQRQVLDVAPARVRGSEADVTATLQNDSADLVYDVELTLVRDGAGRWQVRSTR